MMTKGTTQVKTIKRRGQIREKRLNYMLIRGQMTYTKKKKAA